MIKSQRLTSCTKTKWDEHSISIVNSVEFKSKQKKNLYTYWPINTDLDFEKPWQLLHSLFIKSGLSLGIREMLRILPLKSKESYACYAWECYITITNIFFLSLSLYIYIQFYCFTAYCSKQWGKKKIMVLWTGGPEVILLSPVYETPKGKRNSQIKF